MNKIDWGSKRVKKIFVALFIVLVSLLAVPCSRALADTPLS